MDESIFPKLTRAMVNKKKVLKNYRKRFLFYETMCRLRFSVEDTDIYKSDCKQICDIVSKTLTKESTYDIGNHFFIFSILDSHFDVLKEISESKMNFALKNHLKPYYKVVHDKNSKMIELLEHNLINPITQEQMEQAIKKQESKSK